ncbi:MAG: PRC-barrel domain containing protein [Thermoleophilia bacterium]|nr:PRC-barrel domain containing protein [Thermoleophilia bacterium]
MVTSADLWTYREPATVGQDLTGYDVEALDGGIGSIDEATYDVGRSFLVVDTGPWIFGKKVLIPAGVVDRVDHDEKTVWVNRGKDEIKNSPEFDETAYSTDEYRTTLSGYYGPGGAGWRDTDAPY